MIYFRVPFRRLFFFVVIVAALVAGADDAGVAQALGPDDVVLWTATASSADVHGDWVREPDSTAAGGAVLRNPDRGTARVSPALASPANYFEMRFSATRATAYHLWVRMRAENDANRNDSVHVQFSDSVDSLGQSIIRIGTTGSAEVILQNGSGGGAAQGWGWTDNGWGMVGTPIYFAADGPHVIRIQQREDGAAIDQIVLSPVTFAVSPPGAGGADSTILRSNLGRRTDRIERHLDHPRRVCCRRSDIRDLAGDCGHYRRRVAGTQESGCRNGKDRART